MELHRSAEFTSIFFTLTNYEWMTSVFSSSVRKEEEEEEEEEEVCTFILQILRHWPCHVLEEGEASSAVTFQRIFTNSQRVLALNEESHKKQGLMNIQHYGPIEEIYLLRKYF